MKKITIINQDSGYLMIDIANTFANAGHEVSLITGRLVERNTPLHPSIKMQRVLHYKRNSISARLLTWFGAFFQILFLVWFRHRKAHLFIVSNPPMAPLLPLFCSNPYSLLIYDIYPDALSDSGMIGKKSLVHRFWAAMNRKVYPRAEKLFCLTKGMKTVLEKYSGNKTVEVVPIWTDNQFFKPVLPENNPFIADHNLQGKFIVMYSGNIGISGELGTLLDVAKEVKNREIVFLIIGDGAKKEQITNRIREEKIENCRLLPWQEPSVLPFSLSAASLAVVTLGRNVSKLAIPSKTFNFFSVGVPVISIAPVDSDLAVLVNSNEAGKSFNTDQGSEIRNFILEMKKNKDEYERLKENALTLSKKFTPENARRFL